MKNVNTTKNPTITFNRANLKDKKKFLSLGGTNVSKFITSGQGLIRKACIITINGKKNYIAHWTGRDLVTKRVLVPGRMPSGAIQVTAELWHAFGRLVNIVTGKYDEFNADMCLVSLFQADKLLKVIYNNYGYEEWQRSPTERTHLGMVTVDTYPHSIVNNIKMAVQAIGWMVLQQSAGNVATLLDCPINSPETFGFYKTRRFDTLDGFGYVLDGAMEVDDFVAGDTFALGAEQFDNMREYAVQFITKWHNERVRGKNKTPIQVEEVLGRFQANAEASIDVFLNHDADRNAERNAQREKESNDRAREMVRKYAKKILKKIIAGVVAEINDSDKGLRLGYVDNEATKQLVSDVRENVHHNHVDDFEEALAGIRSFITGTNHGSDAKKAALAQVGRIICARAFMQSTAGASFQPLYWLAISLVHRIIEVAD